jgi:hypothetical protein|nr:MAG TPA: hypothetical protein [Caudoviricetes sp.]
MANEQPLNLDAFFMSRNEIANRHGGKLELQALARVREHMVEEASKKQIQETVKPIVKEETAPVKPNVNQDKKEK